LDDSSISANESSWHRVCFMRAEHHALRRQASGAFAEFGNGGVKAEVGMPLRILVIDDHHVVRRALRNLLEQSGLEVVGETNVEGESVEAARDLRPDVVVLGMTWPVARCLAVVRQVTGTLPVKGVVLVASEDYLVAHVLHAGARGYVLKSRVVDELPRAIATVAAGRIYVSPGPSAVVEPCSRMANSLLPVI
jgi:CheY-like chemotaxis protein